MAMIDELRPRNEFMRIVRWIARVWAALLLVFWGVGFLGNFVWLSKPDETMPAEDVWKMILRFSFILGLAIGFRWEIAGAVVVLLTAPLYLLITNAGRDGLAFVVLTAIPAVIWLVCGLIERRRNAEIVVVAPEPPATPDAPGAPGPPFA